MSILKTPDEIELAETQIKEIQVDYNYRIVDYSIGELLKKFVRKGEAAHFEDESISGLYVPTYQRDFIWSETMQSKFIESLFMGVPIQPLFAFELNEDGNLELLDGVQRLSSIKSFVDGNLVLNGLDELDSLNAFRFDDLGTARKRKFLNTQLKLYIINENTDEGIRADIFRRVNEGGRKLEPAEIRKGKFIGNKFYEFILEMSNSSDFNQLFSSSKETDKLRGEKEELVSRFFALSNNYTNFVHSVKEFMDDYIISANQTFDNAQKQLLKEEFFNTLNFVQAHFPSGFKKSLTAKSIPRVRFEAIAVGTNLALRINPELNVTSVEWLDSNEFKKLTTSDAANSKNKVAARIEFVRDCLLGKKRSDTFTYGN
jgi:hypothetical protein